MKLIVLDIVSNNYKEIDGYLSIFKNCLVLALTPSSIYYLENRYISFRKFHDLILPEQFRNEVLEIYSDILMKNIENKYFKGFFRDIAQVICQLLVVDKIISFIKKNSLEHIIYITDRQIIKNLNINRLVNNESILNNLVKFDKIIQIEKNIVENRINLFKKIRRYSIAKLSNKLLRKLTKSELKYDWNEFNIKPKQYDVETYREFFNFDISHPNVNCIDRKGISFKIEKSKTKISNLLTFLGKDNFQKVVDCSNQSLFFFQHGSYLYKNLFIKYSEIEPARINFVFNDYTKKLFNDLGAKEVHSVGSVLFNQPIIERKKKYDFLYIIQGHDYLGSLQYVDFPNSLHGFDGYELYQRHKSIIELFGTKLSDKKIVIRVHPCVISTGVYVPFWELAEAYPNITIDVSIPIHILIEKSKYIISDYFTTEFINRELHYKRDIILFQGAPTPLPEDIIEDMRKMFILVDSVDDLKDKIENIDDVVNSRKRCDDIIEYYSSKKCDTKKRVSEILVEEKKS